MCSLLRRRDPHVVHGAGDDGHPRIPRYGNSWMVTNASGPRCSSGLWRRGHSVPAGRRQAGGGQCARRHHPDDRRERARSARDPDPHRRRTHQRAKLTWTGTRPWFQRQAQDDLPRICADRRGFLALLSYPCLSASIRGFFLSCHLKRIIRFYPRVSVAFLVFFRSLSNTWRLKSGFSPKFRMSATSISVARK